MKYSIIKEKLGHTCRNCLNEQFGIELMPMDCYYQMYPMVCSRCGETRNIVEEIRPGKRLSIRFMPYKG